jgi:hypothetical protein
MATLYDPTVIINNRRYYFKPNTVTVISGLGEVTVTALSAGGGAVDTAHSEDVSTKVGHIKGTVDLNKTNDEDIKALKALPLGSVVVKITEADYQESFVKCSVSNDPEKAFKVDSEMPIEIKGNPGL